MRLETFFTLFVQFVYVLQGVFPVFRNRSLRNCDVKHVLYLRVFILDFRLEKGRAENPRQKIQEVLQFLNNAVLIQGKINVGETSSLLSQRDKHHLMQ